MATFILRSILLDGFLNSLEQMKWEGERHLEKAAVGLLSEYFQLSTEQHQMQDPFCVFLLDIQPFYILNGPTFIILKNAND